MRTELASHALDRAAVEAVVSAARQGRAVVVPHQVPSGAIPDNAALHRVAASLPASWWCATEGVVDAVTCTPPVLLQPSLPGDSADTIVTRLYHVQQIAELKPLTDSVYDVLEPAWSPDEPWVRRDAGFFLSSSGAVTSAHADRHHNLLLQLTGSKEIGVVVPGSRAHARIVARSMPSLRCEQMPPDVQTLQLPAGSALYLPPYSVHWVRSTEDSVALSCGWNSAATAHAGEVYEANAALLRLKIPAQTIGRRTDALKLRAVAAARRVRPGGPKA